MEEPEFNHFQVESRASRQASKVCPTSVVFNLWRVFPNVPSRLKLHTKHKFQFSSLIAGESDELEHPDR